MQDNCNTIDTYLMLDACGLKRQPVATKKRFLKKNLATSGNGDIGITMNSKCNNIVLKVWDEARKDHLMWTLMNMIRKARIRGNATRVEHLEKRFDRLSALGWKALP